MNGFRFTVCCLLFSVCPCRGDEPPPSARPSVKVRIGGPNAVARKQTCAEFDHTPFDELLKRFVDQRGRVCYRALHEDCRARGQLLDYLESLGGVDCSGGSGTAGHRIAFYVNAYNALAIWGVLRDYPTASIQLLNRPKAAYRVFDDLGLWLGGRYLSLNQIENEVLRPMKEPRIHFALVCAAKGCPRLRAEAYTAERLEHQLTDNAVEFFADRRRFRLCRLTCTVWLSPILKWYSKDFGGDDRAVVESVLTYLPEGERDWLARTPCYCVEHLGYDWGLNDCCAPLHARLAGAGFALYSRAEPIWGPALRAAKARPR